jgi:hypothetical protein
MPALAIRQDLPAAALRRLVRREPDRRAAMRLLAIAHALDGFSRAEAARLAGMERQALRDAVIRYNVYGRPPPCKGVLATWLASSVRAARVYPASHAA